MKFPVEFKECPHCGSKGTLYLEAFKDATSKPSNPFAFLEKKLSPLQNPMGLSLPTTSSLMRHYDTCASCGLEYCVRAEVLPVPTALVMQAMGMVVPMPAKK